MASDRTYVFDVPCTMAVTVQAKNLQQARKKVQATIENKAVYIEKDLEQGYVTMGPDTGTEFELLDSYKN
jgi:hypothetical protein